MKIEELLTIFQNENYSKIVTVILILSFIYGLYQKIKFSCLEKASEMVAAVEDYKELSGKEKFSLVVLWINDELPKIFRSKLFQSMIEKLIDFAYNTSHEYMKKYIERKTGENVSSIIEKAVSQQTVEEKKETEDDNNQ